MINKYNLKAYCCDEISLIENYEKAIADTTQTWVCHHRLETDRGVPRDLLKMLDMYYNVPAEELILLPPAEHISLHMKYRKMSPSHKAKIGYANMGEKNYKAKSIYQIDKSTGAIIKEWKCIREVERELKVAQSNITACCKGRISQAYGYIWRYVEDYVEPIEKLVV